MRRASIAFASLWTHNLCAMSRRIFAAAAVVASVVSGSAQRGGTIGVDELMTLKSIVDVRIAPDGQRVAYVVSTPNLDKNEHDAALYVVPSGGRSSTRLADALRIFNVPAPRPQLRWSPDGRTISVLGSDAGRPEVFGVASSGGEARQLTKAPE